MSRVFTNGPGDRGSIPGRVILNTQKMVFDASLLNTQHYKVRIKGKEGAIQGKRLRPTLNLGILAHEKGAFGLPSTAVANLNTVFLHDGFDIKSLAKVEILLNKETKPDQSFTLFFDAKPQQWNFHNRSLCRRHLVYVSVFT